MFSNDDILAIMEKIKLRLGGPFDLHHVEAVLREELQRGIPMWSLETIDCKVCGHAYVRSNGTTYGCPNCESIKSRRNSRNL